MQRNLHTFQKFLNDNFCACRAKGFADQDFINRFVRLGDTAADKNAFAQRQSVSFHGAFAVE